MSIALLNFTHPGYGTYAMVLLGFYSLVRLWFCRDRPDLGAILRAGLLLFLLGAALSSYMNAGLFFERSYTKMHAFSVNLSKHLRPILAAPAGLVQLPLLVAASPAVSLVRRVPWHLTGNVSFGRRRVLALRLRQGYFAPCWVCLVLARR